MKTTINLLDEQTFFRANHEYPVKLAERARDVTLLMARTNKVLEKKAITALRGEDPQRMAQAASALFVKYRGWKFGHGLPPLADALFCACYARALSINQPCDYERYARNLAWNAVQKAATISA